MGGRTPLPSCTAGLSHQVSPQIAQNLEVFKRSRNVRHVFSSSSSFLELPFSAYIFGHADPLLSHVAVI
jgi:hypothetical protein